MRRSNSRPAVNAGSMADIAFLLLIFFLVTTTISTDAGINRKLPKKCPAGTDCSIILNEKNILRILLNSNNEIMVEDNQVAITDLKELAKGFLDNNGDSSCDYCFGNKSVKSSNNPKDAVISISTDRKSNYNLYIGIQDELTKAYYDLRVAYARKTFKKAINELSDTEAERVRKAYPFQLSEAEAKLKLL